MSILDKVLGSDESIFFEYYEDRFRHPSPNIYFVRTATGELPITKQANRLMDALLAGKEITKEKYYEGFTE